MICTLITIGALTICAEDIRKLEQSPMRPESRCIVVDSKGGRNMIKMPCEDAAEKVKGE